MGIWGCWISCQKVCHLHRGCLADVMDQRPAWEHVRTWRRTPVLMATATHFSDAWGTHKISWTGSQTELSLPWACHQFTICYQMLSNVTSPWHLQPTFPAAHFFRGKTGRGPWILMTWMMQKRPWARSWWICVSRSELLLDWENGPQLMARCGTPIDLGWFPDPNGPVWVILGWVETCAVFAMCHSKNSMLRYDQDWLNTTQQGFFRWVETWNMLKPFESVKPLAICVDFRWF